MRNSEKNQRKNLLLSKEQKDSYCRNRNVFDYGVLLQTPLGMCT